MAKRGRKRGLNPILVSQRTASVDKNILTQTDVLFLHKVRHKWDMATYQDLIPRKPIEVRKMVNKLKVGQALVLQDDMLLSFGGSMIRMWDTSEYLKLLTQAQVHQ